MSPPYRQASFDIIYGQGIDKLGEIMELINDYEVGRKYGKTMTFDGVKYDLEEFKRMLVDNQEFYDSIKQTILNKIQSVDSEPVENEQV